MVSFPPVSPARPYTPPSSHPLSETECVYCAVRPGSSVKTEHVLSLMTVSRIRGIVAGQSRRTYGSIPGQTVSDSWRTGRRPFPEYVGFPLSLSFHHCRISIFIHAFSYRNNRTGRIFGNLQKKKTQCFFGIRRTLVTKLLSLFRP